MTAPVPTVRDVREDVPRQLADDVREGLLARPKTLSSRWFYDQRGSELFEAITELPEYYPTRAETEVLLCHADEIAALTRPEALVELGSGACTKSRLLIDAGRRCGSLRAFVPFDIDEDMVRRAGTQLVAEYPGLQVHGIAGDFNSHLEEGDAALIGVDVVKDARELVAAYDDSAGVTAEFNRNLLHRLNRELGADFDVERFEHVAVWNGERSRIEMHLRADGRQDVRVPGAGLQVQFEDGESVRTEISVKFTRQSIEKAFREAGLRLAAWLTDARERFALALGEPLTGEARLAPMTPA